ncbi:ATP synthase subunit ATP5MPL, mitochondrial [Thalassophryne amazonica]|uniref:ATP synthase subunit ATP5MPL, mitochondrial n=1 Tax=Thalassophryne amazonica TaxID=390379 RepID=UPI001470CD68|nr:ATP synthase subunit ATP5MPL, mitochondrial [Thalassophryne amazonica]
MSGLQVGIKNLWARLGPYYTKAYPEVWVGFVLTTYAYYKISYGGKKKAVQDKLSH